MKLINILVLIIISLLIPINIYSEEVQIDGWNYNLQKADILIRQCYGWNTEKPNSNPLNWYSDPCHPSLYYVNETIIEALSENGVIIKKLSGSPYPRYNFGIESKMFRGILRVKNVENDKSILNDIIDYANKLANQNTSYDFAPSKIPIFLIPGTIISIGIEKKNPEAFYCTELVYYAYKSQGIDIADRDKIIGGLSEMDWITGQEIKDDDDTYFISPSLSTSTKATGFAYDDQPFIFNLQTLDKITNMKLISDKFKKIELYKNDQLLNTYYDKLVNKKDLDTNTNYQIKVYANNKNFNVETQETGYDVDDLGQLNIIIPKIDGINTCTNQLLKIVGDDKDQEGIGHEINELNSDFDRYFKTALLTTENKMNINLVKNDYVNIKDDEVYKYFIKVDDNFKNTELAQNLINFDFLMKRQKLYRISDIVKKWSYYLASKNLPENYPFVNINDQYLYLPDFRASVIIQPEISLKVTDCKLKIENIEFNYKLEVSKPMFKFGDRKDYYNRLFEDELNSFKTDVETEIRKSIKNFIEKIETDPDYEDFKNSLRAMALAKAYKQSNTTEKIMMNDINTQNYDKYNLKTNFNTDYYNDKSINELYKNNWAIVKKLELCSNYGTYCFSEPDYAPITSGGLDLELDLNIRKVSDAEFDNTQEPQVTLDIKPKLDLPNLEVLTIAKTDDNLEIEKNHTFIAVIENTNEIDITNFSISIYKDNLLIQEIQNQNLPAKQTKQINFTLIFDLAKPSTIKIYADRQNQITEDNEADNIIERELTINSNTPQIEIITPDEEQVFLTNQTIILTQFSYDLTDGQNLTYIWYLDSQNISTNTSTNISISKTGFHTISLTAFDKQNNSQTASKRIRVEDQFPPETDIITPYENQEFAKGEYIIFKSEAFDFEDKENIKIEWSSNISGTLSAQKQFTTRNLSTGTHKITLTATDTAKANTTKSITIKINKGTPAIQFLNNKTQFKTGSNITLIAKAQDIQDGDISNKIQLYEGYNYLGPNNLSKIFNDGLHTITAKITDSHQNTNQTQFTFIVLPPQPPEIETDKNYYEILNGNNLTIKIKIQDFEDGTINNASWFHNNTQISNQTQLTINSTKFQIGNNTIKITAKDSTNLTDEKNITINVISQTPKIQKINLEKQIFKTNESAWLSFETGDFEDGFNNTQTEVSSNIDGIISDSNNLELKNLTAGTHKIQIKTTDTHNKTATKYLYLSVVDEKSYFLNKFQNQNTTNTISTNQTTYIKLPKEAQITITSLKIDINKVQETPFVGLEPIDMQISRDGNSPQTAYLIQDCNDLKAIQPDKHYILTNNIDCNYVFKNALGSERVTLDGNGFYIEKINISQHTKYVSLFAVQYEGTLKIKNLGIINSNFAGTDLVGPFLGDDNYEGFASFENLFSINNTITCLDDKCIMGGISAGVDGNLGFIKSTDYFIYNLKTNRSNAGSVAGTYHKIHNSVSKNIIGTNYIYNLLGSGTKSVSNNYLITDGNLDGEGTKVTTEESKDINNFPGLNFSDRWAFDENFGPYLKIAENLIKDKNIIKNFNLTLNNKTINYETELNETKIVDFKDKLIETLNECQNETCLIPITFTSKQNSSINLTNLNIQYQYTDTTPPTITLNCTNTTDINTNFTIKITAADNLEINYTQIKFNNHTTTIQNKNEITLNLTSPNKQGTQYLEIETFDISNLSTKIKHQITIIDNSTDLSIENITQLNQTHINLTIKNYGTLNSTNFNIDINNQNITTEKLNHNQTKILTIPINQIGNIEINLDKENTQKETYIQNNIANFQFLDITKPQIHQITKDQTILENKPFQIKVNATDNINISKITIEINNQIQELTNSSITLTLTEPKNHTATITAYDKQNNTKEKKLTIEVKKDLPDLKIEKITFKDENFEEDKQNTATINITNYKNTELSKLNFFINNELKAQTNITNITNQEISLNFTLNQSRIYNFSFKITNSIEEITKTNNEKNISILSQDLTTPQIQNLNINKIYENQKETINFTIIEKNQLKTCNISLENSPIEKTIQNNKITFNLTSSTKGTKTLNILLTDNSGNTLNFTQKIQILDISPDLKTTNLEFEPENKQINFTIENLGFSQVPDFTASIFINQIWQKDISANISGFGKTQIITNLTNLKVNNNTLEIKLDKDNQIAELNETNNILKKEFFIFDKKIPSTPLFLNQTNQIYNTPNLKIYFNKSNDEFGIKNYEYTLDATKFISNNLSTIINLTLTNKKYTLLLRAIDGSGNIGNTTKINFSIDLQRPTPTNLYEINLEKNWTNKNEAFFIWEEFNDDIQIINYELFINNKSILNTTNTNIKINLSDGTNNCKIRAYDNFGPSNFSNQLTLKIDTIAPNQTEIIPNKNINAWQNTTDLNLNLYSIDISGIENYYYEFSKDSSANVTTTSNFIYNNSLNLKHFFTKPQTITNIIENNTNTTQNQSAFIIYLPLSNNSTINTTEEKIEGTYYFKVKSLDTAKNLQENQSAIEIKIDNKPPTITLEKYKFITGEQIKINIEDFGSGTGNITIKTNNQTQTYEKIDNNTIAFKINTLGTYNTSITASDKLNNQNTLNTILTIESKPTSSKTGGGSTRNKKNETQTENQTINITYQYTNTTTPQTPPTNPKYPDTNPKIPQTPINDNKITGKFTQNIPKIITALIALTLIMITSVKIFKKRKKNK